VAPSLWPSTNRPVRRVPCAPAVPVPSIPAGGCGCRPRTSTCQLDTNIHLWRITAHNAVHRCEVAEMLKAPPHDFRAGAVAPTAPHKPAELGDPGDGLA